VRVKIHAHETLLAGAQILFKPLPAIGAVGYVHKGPVFALDDATLRAALFEELAGLARDCHILFLAVQPPAEAIPWLEELPIHGFHRSHVKMGPVATVWLDLGQDPETLLGNMKARTRYNIRLGRRKGIRIREGSEQDLDVYYDMVLSTSARKEFPPPPARLFREIWAALAPSQHVALLLAEFDERPVAAQLLVTFGDTVVNQLSVWSGASSARKPNDLLHWQAVLWAREHGYRRYDFEGIDPEAARAVLAGEPMPSALAGSYSRFKLGFGGHPATLPGVFDYFYDSAMRAAYKSILSAVVEDPNGWDHSTLV
jgi:lipid II:glycine glycyltransferase (peptidoglycan interpeptide bridge formation enzyme)